MNQYADFNGRARRKEFWMFILFNYLFAILLGGLSGFLSEMFANEGFIAIYLTYILLVFIPTIAVSVRRLHDIGKSGYNILIGFIPFIGGIWLIVLYATNGDVGKNEYGPDPKKLEVIFDEALDSGLI